MVDRYESQLPVWTFRIKSERKQNTGIRPYFSGFVWIYTTLVIWSLEFNYTGGRNMQFYPNRLSCDLMFWFLWVLCKTGVASFRGQVICGQSLLVSFSWLHLFLILKVLPLRFPMLKCLFRKKIYLFFMNQRNVLMLVLHPFSGWSTNQKRGVSVNQILQLDAGSRWAGPKVMNLVVISQSYRSPSGWF